VELGAVGDYNKPVTLSVSPIAGFSSTEASWNNGPFSKNSSITVQNFGGSYPTTSLRVKVVGTATQLTYPVTVNAQSIDRSHSYTFNLNVNKTDTNFEEI
jgi:hypothetical protein